MNKTILIIEDDEQLAKAYLATLTEVADHIARCHDGEEAVAWLETQTPDLVLLDLLMPKKDGFSVLKHIREKFGNTLPVIVLSNLNNQEDVQRAMSFGATKYLLKVNESLEDIRTIVRTALTSENL